MVFGKSIQKTLSLLIVALFALSADHAAAQAAKVVGWIAPADYTEVEGLLQKLKFGSFAK